VAANISKTSKLWHTDYIQDSAERLIQALVPNGKFPGTGYGCPNHPRSSVYLAATENACELPIAVLEIDNERPRNFAFYGYRRNGHGRAAGPSLPGFRPRGAPEASGGHLAFSSSGVGDVTHWHPEKNFGLPVQIEGFQTSS
jgi:hypothetical protein